LRRFPRRRFRSGSFGERGIPDEAFKPVAGDERTAAREAKKRNASERADSLLNYPVADQIKQLGERLRVLDDFPEDTIEHVRAKADAYLRIEHSSEFERLRFACDVWTAAFFQPYPNTAGGPLTTETLRTALTSGRLADARRAGFVLQTADERHFFHWPLAFPEVFAAGGFDVILGNPPFMGGLKISEDLGDKYRDWLDATVASFKGIADICAAFFRRAFSALAPHGSFGLIATNSIAQGDTRLAGLTPLIRQHGQIRFANRFVKWPGRANVEVNLVCCSKSDSVGRSTLDGKAVEFISSRLDEDPEIEPATLLSSLNKAFQGDVVRGSGFVLDSIEAQTLLDLDDCYRDCVLPYLNGEDLNDDPQQRPSRFVICFHDWPYERAATYERAMDIVRTRVKAERNRVKQKTEREKWWLFGCYRGELRRAVGQRSQVMVACIVTEYWAPVIVANTSVFAHRLLVFPFDDYYHLGLLQSSIHEVWARKLSSTLALPKPITFSITRSAQILTSFACANCTPRWTAPSSPVTAGQISTPATAFTKTSAGKCASPSALPLAAKSYVAC
jgi:hypothetical protein